MINVFHIVSGKTWGGAEQYAYDLVSRLRHDDRFYVEVVCKKNKTVLEQFRKLEVPVSILPLKGMTDLDSPMRFARQLRKGHNIVHVHTFHDAFLAVWARRVSENRNTTIIMTVHGIYHPRTNYLYRKIYNSIDHLIFTSELSRNEFIGSAPKLDVTKSCVIRDSVLPNPLLEDTQVPDLRQTLNIAPEQMLIMYHGKLSHDKGIDVLLKAITQLDPKTYRLVVMGEGSRKFTTEIKGFIVANQLVRNVTLMGFCDNITKFISQCDMGVLPSVAPEALGISNLEYMMQGKPHIGTSNGAQHEYVINGKNGILVTPGNQYELAAAIKMLIDEPQSRKAMGQQAHDDFNRELNYDNFYDKVTALYKNLRK
ncbi:MAG: glycosyltransferase family 4 protein [Bacteroidales bacterium]|nr:glycosyltransferase family 4 protein [Candidatus Sodaliphilus limicaballi]